MASILKVRDADGTVHEIYSIQGKSAYQYAQDGGYTGTEEEFAEKMAAPLSEDETLNLLIEEDMLPAVRNADGAILTDQNGNIVLRY